MKRKLYLEAMEYAPKYPEDTRLTTAFFTTIKRQNGLNTPTYIKEILKRYRMGGYKDLFGITLKEYMSLSTTEMTFLDDCRDEIVGMENEEMENILRSEDENNNDS